MSVLAQWNSRTGLKIKGHQQPSQPRLWHVVVCAQYEHVASFEQIHDGKVFQAGDLVLRKEKWTIPHNGTKYCVSDLAPFIEHEINRKIHEGETITYAEFTAHAR